MTQTEETREIVQRVGRLLACGWPEFHPQYPSAPPEISLKLILLGVTQNKKEQNKLKPAFPRSTVCPQSGLSTLLSPAPTPDVSASPQPPALHQTLDADFSKPLNWAPC